MEQKRRKVLHVQPVKASDDFPSGQISPEQLELFRIGEILGNGSYGLARKATYLPNGKDYVVKVIPKTMTRVRRMAINEASVGMTFDSSQFRSICRTFAFCEDEKNVYIIMEYVAGMDLNKFIAENPGFFEKNNDMLLYVMGEILDGINHLHKAGFVHSDIKPKNVLIGLGTDPMNILSVKICDFGMCKHISDKSVCSADGTIGYQAPEITKNKPIGKGIDIWSMGMTWYKMIMSSLPPCIYSKEPVYDLKKSEIVMKLRSLPEDKMFNPFEGESTNPKIDMIRELVKLCLTVNPLFRPTSEQLLEIVREIAPHFQEKDA